MSKQQHFDLFYPKQINLLIPFAGVVKLSSYFMVGGGKKIKTMNNVSYAPICFAYPKQTTYETSKNVLEAAVFLLCAGRVLSCATDKRPNLEHK